jgi:2-iminobutanoate/2-iminopropanoate deaminase
MTRKVIHSDSAPKAIGPYSQAVEASGNRMLFLSGQIPLDPATGNLVVGDITVEMERVMKNLEAVLAAGNATFGHVVRCTIFLTDLGDFAKVNEVYARFFAKEPPARVTLQVSALPKGAHVEVDAIAVV